jgi:ABC-2 type transport system permease protein
MLFLMPMALVLIMTSLQDNTFKAINESGINLIILNSDTDSLGIAIEKEIVRSDIFRVHRSINGQNPTETTIKEAVAAGRYQIGIVIPADATRRIRERVQQNVMRVFSGDTAKSNTANDSVRIMLYIDPVTRNSLRSTLQGSIREYAASVESRIVLNELSREINLRLMMPVANLNHLRQETVYCREEYVARGNKTVIPNSVQHNVPAWTLFAMFFIVIPFASAMIREREDGSLARLLTMPCTYADIMISKTLVYLAVCLLQFILILMMGVYLFPLIGMPSLEVAGRIPGLSLMAVTASFAAIGYGISVGTIARTHQQAAIFASISVVILAAIGGIWVPVFIMPPLLREISVASPLNWGLNGFYDILIRNAGLADVIHYGFRMLLFSFACLLVAVYYHQIRRNLN